MSIKNKECRICYETKPPLISPCGCKGSMKYIHPECLDECRFKNKKEMFKCRICNKKYNTSYEYRITEECINILILECISLIISKMIYYGITSSSSFSNLNLFFYFFVLLLVHICSIINLPDKDKFFCNVVTITITFVTGKIYKMDYYYILISSTYITLLFLCTISTSLRMMRDDLNYRNHTLYFISMIIVFSIFSIWFSEYVLYFIDKQVLLNMFVCSMLEIMIMIIIMCIFILTTK